jgi:purine-binding chemotaxis protein CheW
MPGKQSASVERQLVVFELDGRAYGIEIGAVREVVHIGALLRAQGTAGAAEGIVSLRGRAVPVVSLRARFGLPRGKRTGQQRVVVVDAGGQDIGVVVDAVTEVCRVAESAVLAGSGNVEGASSYVSEVAEAGGRTVMLLDTAKLVSQDEAEWLAEMAEAA